MAIGIFNNLTAFSVIRAKINSLINVIDGVTEASDIDVPLANVAGAGTAAAVNTGTFAGNVPTVAQADARYAAIAHVGATGSAHGAATTAAAGFMSSADKTKLNGIAPGAQVNVGTDLSVTYFGLSARISSSTGANDDILAATTTTAGLMSAPDKAKLDAVEAGAQVNVGTDLSVTYFLNSVRINSSTGIDDDILAATPTTAGLMSAPDKAKLDAVEAGAQVNVGTNLTVTYFPNSVRINNSTGSGDDILAATTTTAGLMRAADKVKLDDMTVWPGVYSGSSSSNVTFPIGATLLVADAFVSRVGLVTVRISDAQAEQYSVAGAGALLTGVWRQRGALSGTGPSATLVERIA